LVGGRGERAVGFRCVVGKVGSGIGSGVGVGGGVPSNCRQRGKGEAGGVRTDTEVSPRIRDTESKIWEENRTVRN
jgi:hypothetical protein